MASIENVFILGFALLVAVIFIYVRVDEIGKRLTRIEDALEIGPGKTKPAAPDDEVINLLRDGKVNKATILYWKRTMIPLRDAELLIQKLQSSLAE